ncbi:MAG: hypothetical protein K9N34_01395 [Candidatus Marinimicrobia bacterium]|nr:hypothetical protein [Candidatus Neomarinimicrobiota bacterium]MCF7840021.1 hypothetical protein [Candidatus Neomarinimicrobiota bacterium]MCF7902133.1 hypothetical protein [Candidatus Neomarinimicrobiota bacterium]
MSSVFHKYIIPILLLALIGTGSAQNLVPGQKPEPVRFWLSNEGEAWGYLTRDAVFLKEDSGYTHLRELKGVTQALLSPNGQLALLAQHEPYRSRLRQSLITRFWIIDQDGREWLNWEETNAADETRWQAAISNAGILALLDPGYARLKLIAPNGRIILDKKLIKSTPMTEHTTVFNLERKGRLGWVNEQVMVVLEEQAFRPQHADNVLTLAFDANGSLAWESKLPLTQIQGALFDEAGLFISGYDWHDTDAGRQFRFQLLQVNVHSGQSVNQWQRPAKQMTISPDGGWLAVLAEADSGYRIDLKKNTLEAFSFHSETEFFQHLVVNDAGEVMALAVSKSNFHPLEIFKSNRIKLMKPLSGETLELQTTGIQQDQLHLQTDGKKYYLGDTQRWREVGE